MNKIYRQWIFNDAQLDALLSNAAKFKSHFIPPEYGVSPESPQSLKAFYVWAKENFPTENYGYQMAADKLARKDPYSSYVLPPRMEHRDDSPNGFHQCFHTALAARGYFSQLGIPSEFFHVGLPGLSHNVAVAYFNSDGRILPHFIDASPFRRICQAKNISAISPVAWPSIIDLENFAFPIERISFGGTAGGIPWFGEELANQNGVLLGFAAVHDKPATPITFPVERGTPEFYALYYGSGPRKRTPLIDLRLLPTDGSEPKFFTLWLSESDYRFEPSLAELGVRNETQDLIIHAVKEPAKLFLKTAARLGLISNEEFV